MISHIFSDLDGTLLNEDSIVTPETIKTIQVKRFKNWRFHLV